MRARRSAAVLLLLLLLAVASSQTSLAHCKFSLSFLHPTYCIVQLYELHIQYGGSVAEWLACWTEAQKSLGSSGSRDAVW